MKTSNDVLALECSVIDIADLARVQGGLRPADGGSSSSTSTTTTTNTNKGADPAYYCKNGLDTQVDVKDASLKLKTPMGLQLEGHVAGTVTVCR
jgi:hypothetical protein